MSEDNYINLGGFRIIRYIPATLSLIFCLTVFWLFLSMIPLHPFSQKFYRRSYLMISGIRLVFQTRIFQKLVSLNAPFLCSFDYHLIY